MNSITIRALDTSEWETFRDVRLAALKESPGTYFTGYEEVANWSADAWQDAIKGLGHQVFGLFDGNQLIGITAAFTDREDPTGQTALLAMSYIKPAYRARGLSDFLYRARLAWIRSQPQFRRVVVSHRKSNEASRRANQRYGFVQINVTSYTWPDGETEDNVSYELAV
jgi:RimJ/RimL family protein N-acetyltransferase